MESGLARVLVEQCPNQIHLANSRATRDDYVGGLKLTPGQFEALKTLQPGQGMFLLIQGDDSVVLQFPLHGLDEYVRVLSARESDLHDYNGTEMAQAAE